MLFLAISVFCHWSFKKTDYQPTETAKGCRCDQTDVQHLLDLHPNSKYPAEWTSDPNEDRAGYVSMEKSAVYAETAKGALELAGLGKVVKVSLDPGVMG